MKIEFADNKIRMDGKVLNALDREVLSFVKMLRFRYVIISGYIAILFGRSRITEDVDVFVESIGEKRFTEFYKALKAKGYYIINALDREEAFDLLTIQKTALRIARVGEIIPNFELKVPKDDLGRWSLDNAIKIEIGSRVIKTSPLELQIAFKLFLGSEKDYYDARQLYKVLKPNLDKSKLKGFIKTLKINADTAKEVLGDKRLFE